MVEHSWIWIKRCAAIFALAGVVAFAALVLASRYWVLPGIDSHRDEIAAALSRSIGLKVTIGAVAGRWSALWPSLDLSDVQVYDKSGRRGLVLSRVKSEISWRSALRTELTFRALEISGPTLAVRRDAAGKFFVAGIALGADENQGSAGLADWLLRQPKVVVRDAVVAWQDATLSDRPLVIRGVTVRLENSGSRHRFAIRANAAPELAQAVDVRGDVRGNSLSDAAGWSGQIFASLDYTNFDLLRTYLPLPQALQRGEGGVRAWLEAAGGKLTGATADVRLRNLSARVQPNLPLLELAALNGRLSYQELQPGFSVAAKQLTLTLRGGRAWTRPADFALKFLPAGNGKPERGEVLASAMDLIPVVALADALPFQAEQREKLHEMAPTGQIGKLALQWSTSQEALTSYSAKGSFVDLSWRGVGSLPGAQGLSGAFDATEHGGTLSLESARTELTAASLFAETLRFDTIAGRADWKTAGGEVDFNIRKLALANTDFAGALRGTLQIRPGAPPHSDLTGKLTRADARAVWRYVPLVVGEKTRRWLQTSLLAGNSRDTTFQLKGDLRDFPFADDQGGVFEVITRFGGGELAYAEQWPPISAIAGEVKFRGKRMDILASEATIFDTRLAKVVASIADLSSHEELLDIAGEASGSLADKLKFITHSPVNAMLHGFTEDFVATGNGNLGLKLMLPLRHLKDTRIAGNYEFQKNGISDAKHKFPPLSEVTGRLQFSEAGVHTEDIKARLLGGPATLGFVSKENGEIAFEGRGSADAAALAGFVRNPALTQLSGKAEWKGTALVRQRKAQLNISAQVMLLGEPASLTVVTRSDGNLGIDAKGKTSVRALAREFSNPLIAYLDGSADWTAQVDLHDDKATIRARSTLSVFGQPASIRIVSSPQGDTTLDGEGRITSENLSRVAQHPMLQYLHGATDWSGHVEVRKDQTEIRLTSSLQGLASDLPEPLDKRARDTLPLRLEDLPATGGNKLLTVSLGKILSAQVLHAESKADPWQIRRAEVRFGGVAPTPTRDGIWIAGNFGALDIDDWRAVLHRTGKPAAQRETAGSALPLAGVDVKTDSLIAFGKEFSALHVKALKQERNWHAELAGEQLKGVVDWDPAGKGKLSARLQTLIIPAGPADEAKRDAEQPARVETNEPADFPALDIVADTFGVRALRFGKLELTAIQEGRDWRLEKLKVSNPDGALSGAGVWQGWLTQPSTTLNLDLAVSDIGRYLGRIGYPDSVKRGAAGIKGRLSWDGNPYEFNAATLSGNFKLEAKSGQFLKISPGAGKLLGLISLQSLPRRIKLDFRDVFSEGFAFDAITGNIQIDKGMLSTKDFQMKGPAALATMAGRVDLEAETQNVIVKVVPAVGDSISLASAFLGGPVVGAATFLMQKLLKNPFDQLLSYEYAISGTWSDPMITKLPRAQWDAKSPLAPNVKR
jgi:uncharacterized protein YhdP